MNDVQMELDMLGSTTMDGSSSSNLGGVLLSLLSKFSSNFANTIEGRVNHTHLSTTTNSSANTNHLGITINHHNKPSQPPSPKTNYAVEHEYPTSSTTYSPPPS